MCPGYEGPSLGGARKYSHRVIAVDHPLSNVECGAPPVRTCDICGYVSDSSLCPVCGSQAYQPLDPIRPDRTARAIPREIIDLAADPDVRAMPREVRQELFLAAASVDPDDIYRTETDVGPDVGREPDYGLNDADRLLMFDLDGFWERSARLIKARAVNRIETRRCPLCDFELAPRTLECDNCGARLP
jgi:hypothetical protein